MLKFSARSMGAYAALYKSYNDIDIYVEDSTLVGLYERLFSKFIGSGVKISAVIPLENKRAVIAEAIRLREDKSRKRFFLVDGDFDWATGRAGRIPKLYMLRCYSIENFAWDSHAIFEAAHSISTHFTRSQVERLCTQDELNRIVRLLLPLFVVYAAAWSLQTTNTTTSYSVMRLMLSDNPSCICNSKTRQRIRMMYRLLAQEFGRDTTIRKRKEIATLLRTRGYLDARLISGKDYLLPILLKIFQHRFGFRGNSRQLLSLILEHSRLTVDRRLRRAFARSLKG